MSEPLESSSEPLQSAAAVRDLTVGERLAQAREARGLTVDDVAAVLKLGPRQVAALEAGEWQGLPGNTFVRGFVRNYARYLELDVDPLMAELDAVLKKPADTLKVGNLHPAEMPTHGGGALFHKGRRLIIWLAGIAIVAVLVGVVALVAGNASSLASFGSNLLAKVGVEKSAEPAASREPAAPVEQSPVQDPVLPPGTTPQQVLRPQALAPAELAPVSPAPATAPVETQGLRIVLATESLLEVRDADNKVVFFQRQTPAGLEQAIAARGPLTVTLGNAVGARLFWKGKEIDLAPYTKGSSARLILE